MSPRGPRGSEAGVASRGQAWPRQCGHLVDQVWVSPGLVRGSPTGPPPPPLGLVRGSLST
eukprot:SAG11_NODE_16369_length_549_cov_1.502222_1_plen_59_part_10